MSIKNLTQLTLRHSLLLIAFIVGLNLHTHAQSKKEQTLLWEVSGKDLTKPSYLFGTYHFAGKDFVDTMKVLNAKLSTADAVVGEIVIDKNVFMKLVPFMTMKGNTLDKLLSPEEYQLVDNYLKQFPNVSLKAFNTMKPVVVQTMILQFTAPKTFTAANPAIDEYFQTYAKANQKKTLGLETAEDQASVLFGSSLERQKELLVKYVKESEKNAQEGKKLYQSYITQDLAALEKLFNDTSSYTAEEMDQLLKNRNDKWLAQLPGLMKDQSLFIAVGAGHLVGKDGLIKGLRAKGYTVKPIATQ